MLLQAIARWLTCLAVSRQGCTWLLQLISSKGCLEHSTHHSICLTPWAWDINWGLHNFGPEPHLIAPAYMGNRRKHQIKPGALLRLPC